MTPTQRVYMLQYLAELQRTAQILERTIVAEQDATGAAKEFTKLGIPGSVLVCQVDKKGWDSYNSVLTDREAKGDFRP